ncbi:DinB family protein [Allomuricauda sp. R78024]|uniref:DinB family protein n=1 Tax=Allomuricauda sp. R78024 TaxID=3093867 RepID=UPI0037C6BFC9
MRSTDLPVSEYNPYYHTYILALGDVNLMDSLKEGMVDFSSFMEGLPEGKLNYSYGEGKWTLAEVLMHIIDAERVFQYRALRFGRNDDTSLAGFDQDIYVPQSNASGKTEKEILDEYQAVRNGTISLFKSFDDDALKRIGMASDSKMSTRAMGFIICGHQAHHLKIIRERYS